MTRITPRRSPWFKAALAALLLALFAAACGGDDGDAGGSSDPDGSTAGEDPGTPVDGGEANVLVLSEIGTLDPVKMTGSAGSDGLRAFALYGALVTYDSDAAEALPVLAESLTPDAAFTTWTLKLKPGITFSDGTPFDAAAVQANWERAQDVSMRSPALTTVRAVESMEALDATTLTITLSSPNANFDASVARTALNYIASPTAFQSGQDLTSDAVGAGPYLLTEWLRDDRMVLEKNPDWKGSEGAYLDKITLRVLGDEEQRIDTFLTGQGDAFYTATPSSVIRAQSEMPGAEHVGVSVTTGLTYVFNTEKPPFDDIRVRKAFIQGVDWQAFADTVFGEGAVAATNFTLEGTPWYTEDATLPGFDPDEAQRLIDEYVADNGGPLEITANAFQQNLDQARARFIQTSLSQLENIEFEVQVGDSPSNIGKVLAGDFMLSSWGFPAVAADPGLYNSAFSESTANYSGYSNPDVDAKLLEARQTDDLEARVALYQDVFRQLAEDLPYYPYLENVNGYVVSPDLHGGQLYEDGILRLDLLWKSA